MPGNNIWMARENCYCCERWKLTLIFIDKVGMANADQCYLEGSFEFLNTHSKLLRFMDVREYARLITESTGEEATDLERYFEFMPQEKRERIQGDNYQMGELKSRFREKDPKIY